MKLGTIRTTAMWAGMRAAQSPTMRVGDRAGHRPDDYSMQDHSGDKAGKGSSSASTAVRSAPCFSSWFAV